MVFGGEAEKSWCNTEKRKRRDNISAFIWSIVTCKIQMECTERQMQIQYHNATLRYHPYDPSCSLGKEDPRITAEEVEHRRKQLYREMSRELLPCSKAFFHASDTILCMYLENRL